MCKGSMCNMWFSSNQQRCRKKKIRQQLGRIRRTNITTLHPDVAGLPEKLRRVSTSQCSSDHATHSDTNQTT